MKSQSPQKRKFNIVKQRFEILVLNPEFQQDIENIRKKYPVKLQNRKILKPLETSNKSSFAVRLEKEESSKEYVKDLGKILKKYNLSDNYKRPLNTYVLDNCIHTPFNLEKVHLYILHNMSTDGISEIFIKGVNLKIICELDEKNRTKKLLLEISPETTIKDIEKAWTIIKRYRKELVGYKEGRKKPLINIKKDKRIWALSKQGISHREIAEIIKKEFNIKSLAYYEIAKTIWRFKKKIMDT